VILSCSALGQTQNAETQNAETQNGQTQPNMSRVLERLDRLEQENRELIQEIRQLRTELHESKPAPAAEETAPAQPPDSERLDVLESRTADLAQTKIGSTQRMPVSLTGMVLFNAFSNSRFGGTNQYPLVAGLTPSPSTSGATLRQTVLGLKFDGPALPGGGKVSGNFYFDFFAGTTAPTNNLVRIRVATLDLAWTNTTLTFGQDKPIVAPRDPTSLAQVGYPPLTGAGNLWDWNPQVRIEQRFRFSDETGIRAQAGVFQTTESYPGANPPVYANTLERSRPAWQGRFEFYHDTETRKFEVAPGFSVSDSLVLGQTAPSRLFTVDWLARPTRLVEFTGSFFHGTNASGLGGLRQGFTVTPGETVNAVHTTGGWAQVQIFATSRLSFHFYGGEESDRARDLNPGSLSRNIQYAGNAVYKLAPNVISAFEVSQTRSTYLPFGLRLVNHYDLAIGYLF
jgi:hypothetical protein